MAGRDGPRIRLLRTRPRHCKRGRVRASKFARWRFSNVRGLYAQANCATDSLRVVSAKCLTLRELEAAAGFGSAVFLALDDARIAGKEATALKHAAQVRFIAHQRLGQAVPHCTGLAG